jgi:hypothetical protein
MKLSELLEKLDTEERPYYGQTDFFEECCSGFGWAPLEGNGFTYRPIKEWNCTDSWVGDNAIYHNGELICITHQPYRKSSVEFKWVSKEIYDRISAFVRSLDECDEEDNNSYIDFDSEVDTTYRLKYTNQLLRHHSTAFYHGKKVTIDWDLSMQEKRNEIVAENVWVIGDGDSQPIKVGMIELVFEVKLKGDTWGTGTLEPQFD